MSKIDQQLRKALGEDFKEKEGEKPWKYRARLVQAANKKLTDRQWEKLSEPAQDWLNRSVKAIEAGERCPKFTLPPADGESPNGGEDSAEGTDMSKKDKSKNKDKGSKNKDKEAPKKGGGAGEKFVKAMLLNPDWDKAKVISHLENKGTEISAGTANTIFYHTSNAIRIGKELGLLRGAKKAD